MKTKSDLALASCVAALAIAAGAAPALAGETSIRASTGIEYSTGKYGGTQDIDETYVPLTLRVDTSRIGVSVSIPHLSVRGPAGTVTDGQAIPGSGEITTESGLGDITARMTVYDVYYNADFDIAVDVTGGIKLGTADLDKGLGTGENDYSFYLDGYKWFDGFTLLGSVGYRWRGEPEGLELNDVLMGSIGGSWPIGAQATMGFVFDYRDTALEGSDNILEITAFGSKKLGDRWQINAYLFSGFTDSSPDWGAGLALTTDFRRFPFRG